MFFSSRCPFLILCISAMLACLSTPGRAQTDPQLEIYFQDAVGYAGDSDIAIAVYLNNYQDSVAGFELWFRLDRPDIAGMQIEAETGGTLIKNWDYLDARSVDQSGLDVKVTAICDVEVPYTKRGFAPQQGSAPLIILKAHLLSPPSPFFSEARIVVMPVFEHFGFASPSGHSLGIDTTLTVDTLYFRCMHWEEDSCVTWEQVPSWPYDSVLVDSNVTGYVDTTITILHGGWIRRVDKICGDIDGSKDGIVSLGDLTRLIDCLFITLRPLDYPELGNVDRSPDGQISLGDLSAMIDHLFISLEPLDCVLLE